MTEEEDPTIPFIEVGGPSEPGIRLLVPPAEPASPPRAAVRPPEPEALPPELFTVRFQPVHAGRRPGRGFGPELVAYHQPDHPVSVQYRSLAAEILTQLPGSPPRAVAFTAPAPQAGTSTVLLNLAVTLTRQEAARVVVVDAHAGRPALADRLGLPVGPGLREVLARQSPLAWSLHDTAQPNLAALTAGRPGPAWDAAELPGVIELLRGRADWVLVDGGMWDPAAPVSWAEACDAVYLVVRQESVNSPDVVALQETILEATGRLRGCVITQR
jgi:Mrp family chromosome partitioning ATPase